mmetsp:Transcript_27057/g.78792  ORF Transcript_27057/g.78792 Transcript_27057/m.78792 type:complete len:240 (-) Transcript_27057:444-1163(-)
MLATVGGDVAEGGGVQQEPAPLPARLPHPLPLHAHEEVPLSQDARARSWLVQRHQARRGHVQKRLARWLTAHRAQGVRRHWRGGCAVEAGVLHDGTRGKRVEDFVKLLPAHLPGLLGDLETFPSFLLGDLEGLHERLEGVHGVQGLVEEGPEGVHGSHDALAELKGLAGLEFVQLEGKVEPRQLYISKSRGDIGRTPVRGRRRVGHGPHAAEGVGRGRRHGRRRVQVSLKSRVVRLQSR